MRPKKYAIENVFWATKNTGPWGPKMTLFGQKLQVLAKNGDFFGQKI